MKQQANPCWWADDDHEAHDNVPRHASWLLTYADNTDQRIGCWPPMSRAEVMNAYRCADARAEK